MSHTKTVCSCGQVLSQCRCPSKDKVTIVSTEPCPHRPSASQDKSLALVVEEYQKLRRALYLLARENDAALMGRYSWLRNALSEEDIEITVTDEGIVCEGHTYTNLTMDYEWFEFTIPFDRISL